MVTPPTLKATANNNPLPSGDPEGAAAAGAGTKRNKPAGGQTGSGEVTRWGASLLAPGVVAPAPGLSRPPGSSPNQVKLKNKSPEELSIATAPAAPVASSRPSVNSPSQIKLKLQSPDNIAMGSATGPSRPALPRPPASSPKQVKLKSNKP